MTALGAAAPRGNGAWEVASSRPGEPPYQVHCTGRGGQCTCPGFQRWGRCKHLTLVRTLTATEDRMHPDQPQRGLARVPVQPAPLTVEEPSRALANLTIQDVFKLADTLAGATGFLPKGITEPAQVFAIVLTGQEVGIGPMAALRHIYMVEGKPDPSAELLLALIRHRYGPQTIRVVEATADHCTIEWRQQGWDGVQSFTWTKADSERAGLSRRPVHQAYPAAMHRARAIKFVARSQFPEVALGLDLGGEEERPEPPPPARRAAVNDPAAGLLTADELQPGGLHTGEQGGILADDGDAYDPDSEPGVGEHVGLTECARCGAVAECLYDGEAAICADRGACTTRFIQADAMGQLVAPPEDAGDDPALVSGEQLRRIRAHLARTGKSEATLVEELGHPLEMLPPTDGSKLIRDLGRVPNAPTAAVDEGEAL